MTGATGVHITDPARQELTPGEHVRLTVVQVLDHPEIVVAATPVD